MDFFIAFNALLIVVLRTVSFTLGFGDEKCALTTFDRAARQYQ